MAHITGGEVTYVRRKKTGDYEHAEMIAKLSFSLDDGEDYEGVFHKVSSMAVARVHTMLGLKTDTVLADRDVPAKFREAMATAKAEAAPTADPETPGETEAPKRSRGPGRPRKPTEAIDVTEPETPKTPMVDPDDGLFGQPAPAVVEAKVDAPAVIPDIDLLTACKKHADRHGGMEVRKHVEKVREANGLKTIAGLALDKRAAFLAELKEKFPL